MKTQFFIETAELIHWNYGVGEILNVRLFLNGKLHVTVKATSCKQKTYIGKIDGNFVWLHGHRLKVKGLEQ